MALFAETVVLRSVMPMTDCEPNVESAPPAAVHPDSVWLHSAWLSLKVA